MDINKLKVFIDAAETLNFSETAQRLHVTQPTISKYIRDLENELSIRLFERSATGISLSEAGKAIQPWAQKLLSECRKFEDLASSLDEEVTGRIRIACTTAAGKYILPQFGARFRQLHPHVQISILSCTQEDALERILDEEADLSVVSSETRLERIEIQNFFVDQIIMIAPANHPFAHRKWIDLSEIFDEPVIIREPTSGTRRAVLAELAAHDITLEDLNVLLEIGNAEAIVAAVGAGLGLSFVSRLAASCALAFGSVVEVPVNEIDLKRQICMARRVLANPNRARDVFWGFIHDPMNDDLYEKIS